MTEITRLLLKSKEKIVGLDIDQCDDLSLLITYFNARNIADKVRIYHSPSGRGYHMYLYFDRILSLEEKFLHRYALGDCQGRIYFAELRGGDDILFSTKIQDGKTMHRYEISEQTFLGLHNERLYK